MTSDTRLILGPPGTGKTTRLLNAVDQFLKDGVPPERIAYMGYTRKAAHEAIARACERFGYQESQFPWFRTLHSTAFKLLRLAPHDVMNTPDFMKVGDALKWCDFKSQYDASMERPPAGGGKGDNCMTAYYLQRATGRSAREILNKYDIENITPAELDLFTRTLEQYKKEFNRFDFTDFLDLVNDPVDVDVFILDEAQDLTRQQWQFATRISAKAKIKLIAGDDDQAIYEWSGADPAFFQSINAPREVLPVSYRLPRSIHKKCNRIISGVSRRFPKDWSPRDADGRVNALMDAGAVRLHDPGSWLLLARNQYQLDHLKRIASDQGVVYSTGGAWSNQAEHIQAVVTFERLRKGLEQPAAKIREMGKFIRGFVNPPPGQLHVWDAIKWPFDGRPDWLTALNKLTVEEREMIRGLLRRGQSLTKPGRVTISTIHASKGGEADNVLLLTDMSGRNWRGYQKDKDQELRVWYVAASRARENLFYAQSRQGFAFPF